jgi:hypothetical protein
MIAERQQRPTGRLLDHTGRPLNSTAIQPSTPMRGGLPWQPDRNAPMQSPGLVDDSRLIRPTDRRDIIKYLRFALRTDPVVASLLYRYGVAIGSPQMRSVTGVPAYDEERERYMEGRFLDITTTGADLESLNFVISLEEAQHVHQKGAARLIEHGIHALGWQQLADLALEAFYEVADERFPVHRVCSSRCVGMVRASRSGRHGRSTGLAARGMPFARVAPAPFDGCGARCEARRCRCVHVLHHYGANGP